MWFGHKISKGYIFFELDSFPIIQDFPMYNGGSRHIWYDTIN